MNNDTSWKHANADLFWGDVAFCDHVLQVYDNDELYLDAFAGFISTGIHLGDCCVVIVTEAHRKALDDRLKNQGIDVAAIKADDSYISLDVYETLSKFMIDGMPDEQLFNQTMSSICDAGYKAKRLVRAGGEMSPTLSAQGNWKAAIRLEQLTNKSLATNPFSIFCGYSHAAFATNEDKKMLHVCAEHTKMISGSQKQITEVCYRDEVVV